MSSDYQSQADQRFFYVHEDTYGNPYDPESALSAWTALPADYPHWERLDTIPDGADIVPPIIEKIKAFDIGSGKHPSEIINANYKPVEFTIETYAKHLDFLAYAIGQAVTTHTRAEISTITCVAESALSQGDYFLINEIDGDGDVVHYAVWIDTVGNGSTGKPVITGINASKVLAANISGTTPNSTAIEVATAVTTAINTTGAITAANGGGTPVAVVTATNDNVGAVPDVYDGAATTGFTFAVTTQGVSTHTITEYTNYKLESFTMHVEWKNTDSDEDIIYDLFGCVVESIEITSAFTDDVMKASIVIKCPYAVAGNRSTNNPPKKTVDSLVHAHIVEESGSNYYLLRDGATTSVTPDLVNKVTLTITNNVDWKSNIGYRYAQLPAAAKRTVSLNVVGFMKTKKLYTFWKSTWDSANQDLTDATGKVSSQIKFERDDDYDDMFISVYNWLPTQHSCRLVNVDEAIRGLDVTLEDAVGDSNGRIFDSVIFVNTQSKKSMHNANLT